jgi:hypothetical protein
MPKLQCFKLKTVINNNIQFAYLKWILNNLNHIRKLDLCLRCHGLYGADKVILNNSTIDANFIRQYCMPDTIINLTNFDFYIGACCKSLTNNIEKIIDSFKTHRFFIEHGWMNVKCSFDPKRFYQHLASSHVVYAPQFFTNLT